MSLKAKAGVIISTLCAALFTLIAVPGEAFAACANWGCDDSNPNVQSWSSGVPATRFHVETGDNGATIELRSGTTHGDVYTWARMTYYSGSGDYQVFLNRCTSNHYACDWMGVTRGAGTSGYTSQVGTNTYSTWSGMLYDPDGYETQACLIHDGSQYCTGWW